MSDFGVGVGVFLAWSPRGYSVIIRDERVVENDRHENAKISG